MKCRSMLTAVMSTTALGYSLDVADTSVQIYQTQSDLLGPVEANLRTIKLKDIRPVQALLDGIRIHPLRVRFAFTSGGQLRSCTTRYARPDVSKPEPA